MNRHAYTDLLTDLGAAEDGAALNRVSQSFASSCGVTNLLVVVVNDGEGGQPELSSIVEALPLELSVNSVKRRHPTYTPTMLEMINGNGAYDCDAPPTHRYRADYERIWAEFRDYARCDYFYCVPVAEKGVTRGAACYFADRSFLTPDARTALHLLTYSGYERMLQLSVLPPTRSPLTPRQTDALSYCARGKSDWEIGEAMGIAETTAHEHIEAAKRRLGVRTRIQAAVVAVQRGWIKP
ncbi:MAG TPA: LuxR C-terminal-related transcriptional regulator [Vitreimonas sp.]|nr:LuxR C-terminal-related transcriptional regulator [Vitreimonas sp.]